MSRSGRLQQQREESAAKRRIGVGFTGMGNALAMLCLRYDAPDGREMAARIAARMRDAAYGASVALAREKGTFPKFEVEGYLGAGTFASRLPAELQQAIRAHGIRNSHLLSIAPTGHGQSGLCRQRLQWHRARVLLDVPAQEAGIRRQHDGICGGRPRLAPVS
jgi:ribonucleotide reductase alpha subunit